MRYGKGEKQREKSEKITESFIEKSSIRRYR